MSELTRQITVDELTRGIEQARARRRWPTKRVVADPPPADDDDDTVISEDQAKAWVAQSKASVVASLLGKQSK
jgi:hypothetical protein